MDINSAIKKIVGPNKTLPQKSVYLNDWLSWYRGKVLGFHNYRIYNGNDYLECERKTLGMAKKVCEDWANMLMNERCDIIIPDKPKEKLNKILQDSNFWVKANEGIERTFALGIGAFVVGIKGLQIGEKTGIVKKDKAKVKVDFINATKIHPITIEDKEVTECAFVSVNTDYTNIVIHVKNEQGNYVIHNYVINKDGQPITDKCYQFDTKSPLQWFQVIRPNISSNYLTDGSDEEIGISILANSVDTLKAIDNKYDGFDLEFVLGRKRMFIAGDAWKHSKVNGEMVRTFDPYDSLFFLLPETDDGKPVITNKSDELRYDAYIKGINAELSYLSSKCGMGDNYYKFDGASVATATQVISENSTLFRTLKKHEIILESVLINLTKTIIYASNTFTNEPIGEVKEEDITIKFDDSIIEDKETEMARDRLDVTTGIMSKVEYRMKWYGEDEETAKSNISLAVKINEYMTALTTGGITPELFVEKVYGEVENKQELIEYITEYAQKPNQLDMGGLYAGDEN